MAERVLFSVAELADVEDFELNNDSIIINSKGKIKAEDLKSDYELISFEIPSGLEAIELNNRLLSIVDKFIEQIITGGYKIKILGGNFVFNNYLTIIGNIFETDIYYEDFKTPDFGVDIDMEELDMYKSRLKDKIDLKEYNSLQLQWRNIYYFKGTEDIVLSKLGRKIIARYQKKINRT